MDQFRLFAGVVFAISIFLLVDAWVRDHQTPPQPSGPTPATQEQSTPTPSTQLGQAPAAAPKPLDGKLAGGERIRVVTDFLIAQIDTTGGDIHHVEFTKYKDTFEKQKNFVLLQHTPDHVYISQTGLIGEGLPNHTTIFKAAQNAYELAPGADTLAVRLEAAGQNGIKAIKTYTFRRGSYVIEMALEAVNTSSAAIEPFAYFQLVRDTQSPLGDSKMVPVFNGVEAYTEKDKLHKASFEDIIEKKAKYPKSATDGWMALVQHYFLGAWLPQTGVVREYFMNPLPNNLFAAGTILPVGKIEPGQTATASTRLFAGPQEQSLLKTLAPGLELTVDYGWLRPLAVPLFWVLNEIYKVVHNWGVAIIILTVIIKLVFYPLSAASYKSMAKMKVLAPKLQKLKERYGDDRQRMHQSMVELYKTEKINPLGGCLPIVVQIPVFIALYWVLLLSVELRQAPFALWIQDLSRPDPFYILPVLMGITMYIQTWLNPTPPDPIQAKLMKIMPVAFSVFFFFFPSGLVLYWLVNNILSIAQQWRITHVLERAKAAHGET